VLIVNANTLASAHRASSAERRQSVGAGERATASDGSAHPAGTDALLEE
jgi:hypothetical protein